MRKPQAKLGSLDHRHTSAVKAGTTVAVPAAVSTFDEYLDNFQEEMDSEEGGKEEEEAKDKKEVEDDEVREDEGGGGRWGEGDGARDHSTLQPDIVRLI